MKILTNFIIISFLLSQNFIYDEEDWIVVSNPGQINSMTLMYDDLLFTAQKGVYAYSKSNQSMSYMLDFIQGFSNSKFKIIHYDVYRDHLWFLSQEKIFFKPKISSIWREIEFYDLNIIDATNIKNIGSTSDYILIKTNSDMIVLNPYTGKLILYEEHKIENYLFDDMPVKWSSTRYDESELRIDLRDFSSHDEYTFLSNDYLEYNGAFIRITNIIEDDSKNIFIGTDSGDLFKCNLYTKTFHKMPNIPMLSNVNLAYYDDYGEWWISTNDLINFSDERFLFNKDIFFANWKEDINKWSYINNNFNYNLKSSDITSLYRYQNHLYIGTNKGLYIYDLNLKRWIEYEYFIDSYIFNIKRSREYIYIATNEGLEVMLDSKSIVIDSDLTSIFNSHLIMDIEFINQLLYISSDYGLFKYDFTENKVSKISDVIYNKIESDLLGNLYMLKKNKIFQLQGEQKRLIHRLKNIQDFAYCEDFLWVNNSKYASIINLETNELVEYSNVDGLLSDSIYSIDCDKNWVWFSTDNGLVLYNWAKYHDVK